MHFEDIPTTYEDFKYKSKRWPGFSYALRKVGLDKNEVERRILRGSAPWKNEAQQRYNCRKAREKFLSQQKVSKVTPRQDVRTTAPQSQDLEEMNRMKMLMEKLNQSTSGKRIILES